MKATISALMDGELKRPLARKALARLSSDAELRQSWTLYHIIGEALRDEATVAPDITDRVVRQVAHVSCHRRLLARRCAMTAGIAAALAVAVVMVAGSTGERPTTVVEPAPDLNDYVLAHAAMADTITTLDTADIAHAVVDVPVAPAH